MSRAGLGAKAALVVAAVVTLALAGTGVGNAYWTATSTVGGSAAATSATASLTTTSPAVVYSSSAPTGVTELVLANTSVMPLGFALAATASNATGTNISVRLSVTAASCPAVAPSDATTAVTVSSTNAASPTAIPLPSAATSLAASTAVTLCAYTTFASGALAANSGQSTTLTLVATGTIGSWAATATLPLAQSVATATPTEVFFVNSAPRYNILNADSCVSVSGSTLTRTGTCDMWNGGQFRLADTGNGTFTIAQAVNSTSQPADPRWSLSSGGGTVTAVSPSTATAQRWSIVQRADGRYRIQNVATGTCATVSSGGQLVGAACSDALASQGFTFAIIGNPAPATPYAAVCSLKNAQYMEYSWPVNAEYQQETVYRVYVGGVLVSTTAHGYFTTAQLYSDSSGNLVTAGVANGANQAVVIQQSVAGSAWSTIATGSITVTASASPAPKVIACGA